MKILMISAVLPSPDSYSSIPIRTFNLIRHLSHRHDVTLVAQKSDMASDRYIETLSEWLEELVIFTHHQELPSRGLVNRAKRVGQLLKEGRPKSVLSYYSPQMQQWIDQKIAEKQFDVVSCEGSINETYIRREWQSQLKMVVNIHGSLYGTSEKYLERSISAKKSFKEQLNVPILRRYEKQYCSKFSALVTTTNEDKRYIQQLETEKPIKVVPNGVNLDLFPTRNYAPEGYQLIYISHQEEFTIPEEVNWLCQWIFPEIKKRYSQVSLKLVRIPSNLSSWGNSPGIEVAPSEASLPNLLQESTVCVLPIQAGLGMKAVTLQAMASGVPVVGSDRALEGLKVDGPSAKLSAMRANALEEYIYSIGRLFQQESLRERISQNARALVEKSHNWETIAQQYETVLSQ